MVGSDILPESSPVSDVGGKGSLALQTMGFFREIKNPPISLVSRHWKIVEISNKKQLPIKFLGYSLLFTEPRVFRGPKSDWVMVNLKDDPLYYSNGQRLIVPGSVLKDLNLILKSGINFEAMYIAHEIPKESLKEGEGIPLELVAPPPPKVVLDLGKKSERFWEGVKSICGGLFLGQVFSGRNLENALDNRDPVLFGAIFDKNWNFNGRPMGLWYYITSWRWTQ